MTDRIIYALVDPRVETIFYAGKSQRGSEEPEQYINNAHRGSTQRKVKAKLRQIHLLGMRATWELLEEVPEDQSLDDAEKFWIASILATGALLANMTPGGDGVPKGTKPWNAGKKCPSIAAGAIGRKSSPQTEEHKAKRMAKAPRGENHWVNRPGGHEKAVEAQRKPSTRALKSKNVGEAKRTPEGRAANKRASVLGNISKKRKAFRRQIARYFALEMGHG